jgi:hypothetical protein
VCLLSRRARKFACGHFAFPPIVANRVTGAGQPFLVAAKLLKRLGGEKLRGVAGWMTEGFQKIGGNKNWNLV